MIGVAAARTSRATSSPGTSGLKREDDLRRGMVADIAHELRTPVTILQGGTEELLDGIADPTPARLTSLHDETLGLGRLVDDLATLAAAQAAAQPCTVSPRTRARSPPTRPQR
jgi:two-component system sensor histidine kinase BaeS